MPPRRDKKHDDAVAKHRRDDGDVWQVTPPPREGGWSPTRPPREDPLHRGRTSVRAANVRCCSWRRGARGRAARWPPNRPLGRRAHEKSRRSLMLVETLVRCRVRPICSAIPMNRLLNIESCTASGEVTTSGRREPARSAAAAAAASSFPAAVESPATSTSILRSPYAVSSATHPGSTTHTLPCRS